MLRPFLVLLGAATFSVLTACGPVRPATAPVALPEPAATTAASEFRLVPGASVLQARVRPGGALARLGHHHIVASRDLSGSAGLTLAGELRYLTINLPLATLEVDPDDLRAAAGDDFARAVPQKDKDGTRANLLGEELLQFASFDALVFTAAGAVADPEQRATWLLRGNLTVRGAAWPLTLPVSVTIAEGQLVATGQTIIRHQQIGLTPFSVGLGALRVEDDIELHYRIVASRQ